MIPVQKEGIPTTRTVSFVPSIFLTNICHISNKVDELSAAVENNNISSLVLITETWLNSSIPDSAVGISSSNNTHRLDRPNPCGGILAYCDSKVPCTCLFNLEEEGKEVMWLLLKPPRTPRPYSVMLIVTIYYPPGQSKEREREMQDYLTKGVDIVLQDYPSAGVIIAGDINTFNPNILCQCLSLKKLVKAPTRGQNTLDQILTNMKELFSEPQHLPPIGRSDHQCLLLTFNIWKTGKLCTQLMTLMIR